MTTVTTTYTATLHVFMSTSKVQHIYGDYDVSAVVSVNTVFVSDVSVNGWSVKLLLECAMEELVTVAVVTVVSAVVVVMAIDVDSKGS